MSYHNFCSVNTNTLESLTEMQNLISYKAYRMKITEDIYEYLTKCNLRSW